MFSILCLTLLGFQKYAALPIDVLHYRFEIQLNDDNDRIQGQAQIRVRFREGSDQLAFHLNRKQGGTGMKVHSVTFDGKPASFHQEQDRVIIKLAETALVYREAEVRIVYEGVPEDGLIISKNKHGERTFFADHWPNRAHHWLPTNDHPADKATCEFLVTAPNHYQVVANGLMLEETDLPKGLRRTHWRMARPIPTKIMVIGVARFAVQHLPAHEGIPISNWVFPQQREPGFEDFSQTAEILDFFTNWIAPYPYQKLANVQSKTRYGGMENAGAIFYSERSIKGDRSNRNLMAHEIAHQWFGDGVSERDWMHVWLSEGFATYFTALYVEHKDGADAMAAWMADRRERVINYQNKQGAAAIVKAIPADLNDLLNANSYSKGAWVLHMLRHKIGDQAFQKGIRDFYKTYQNGNATTEQLLEKMERSSGQSLEPFFQQWLYQKGMPLLTVQRENTSEGVQVTVIQEQKQSFRFSLDIAFTDKQGKQLAAESLPMFLAQQSFLIKGELQNATLLLDPKTRLLFKIKSLELSP